MTDKIEEAVKKILEEIWAEAICRMRDHPKGVVFSEYNLGDKAKQICQLFKVKV